MDQFRAARIGDLQQLRVALNVHNVNDVDRGWTALHLATRNGSVGCVNYCLEMGANANAGNDSGYTPLYFASSWGHLNVVHVLLDAGAIVDTTSKIGRTPLYSAIRNKHVDVARVLLDRGAKVSNITLGAIPDWVTKFVESRSNCRCAAFAIIGIHKYHRTSVTGNNDINVLRLIAKHIWSMRMDDVWSRSP
jgi:ankyrin repeat protein